MLWQKLFSVFSGFFQGWRSKRIQTIPPEPPKPTILSMPMELLLQIFAYLDLPTQVCFALSSKALYERFSSVLQAAELRFPRIPSEQSRYNQTEEYQQRTQLLIQLEDSRWACCAGCQKLHPCEEFLFLQCTSPPRRRSWFRTRR